MGQSQTPITTSFQTDIIKDDYRGPINNFLHLESQSIQKCKQTPFQRSRLVSRSPQLYAQEGDTTLDKMIAQQRNYSTFPQRELISVLQSCVYGLAYIQKKKCSYLCMSSKNIIYFKAKRTFKLVSPLLTQPQAMIHIPPRYYTAPQMLDIRNRIIHNDVSEYGKADIFSLGMIMLEMALMSPASDCYQNGQLRGQRLQNKFQQLNKTYSENLSKYIGLMLQPNLKNRMDPFQMSLFLNNQINIKPLFKSNSENSRTQASPVQIPSSTTTTTYTVPPATLLPPTYTTSQYNPPISSSPVRSYNNSYPAPTSYSVPNTTYISSSSYNPNPYSYSPTQSRQIEPSYHPQSIGYSNMYTSSPGKYTNFQQQVHDFDVSRRYINQI